MLLEVEGAGRSCGGKEGRVKGYDQFSKESGVLWGGVSDNRLLSSLPNDPLTLLRSPLPLLPSPGNLSGPGDH
ncbi:hypothetical protein STVIR_4201 [Streptomyces viridochromogenes Tue57]|uniref:Uncharacterized protein n=1 Tax=Streptomyces viridochromogenes Tue57 TaxID=1160705 RepID=L8PHH6_STRVR|nr:hypothetical protein STVIR_4201 [Streptomyces viridochromogenes Tue57]